MTNYFPISKLTPTFLYGSSNNSIDHKKNRCWLKLVGQKFSDCPAKWPHPPPFYPKENSIRNPAKEVVSKQQTRRSFILHETSKLAKLMLLLRIGFFMGRLALPPWSALLPKTSHPWSFISGEGSIRAPIHIKWCIIMNNVNQDKKSYELESHSFCVCYNLAERSSQIMIWPALISAVRRLSWLQISSPHACLVMLAKVVNNWEIKMQTGTDSNNSGKKNYGAMGW